MKVRTHGRAERIFFVRRVHILFLEEGDGERGLGVLVAHAKCLVAGLNDPTRTHLIPRRMSLKQIEKAPHLELPRLMGVGESVHSNVGHGFHQVPHLLLVQDEASALARTDRAERLHVGAPVNVAVDAGPDWMSDSFVGLGLLRGHHGNGLDGLDGLHGLDGLDGFSLGGVTFQFFPKIK